MSDDFNCYNCGGKESNHFEGCPAAKATLLSTTNNPYNSQGAWILVEDKLPPDETPVIILLNGLPDIGELRWEHPGWEDTYQAFRYWDNPNDDGKCWEWSSVTHWMLLPELPKEA